MRAFLEEGDQVADNGNSSTLHPVQEMGKDKGKGVKSTNPRMGHIWQERFKAFPIEQDEHLLTVLRNIERNPLRAGLLNRAEDWSWSSLTS